MILFYFEIYLRLWYEFYLDRFYAMYFRGSCTLKPLKDDSSGTILRGIRDNKTEIEDELGEVYLSAALENRYVLHPRRLREIAKDDIEQFLEFLHSENEQKAKQMGRDRARVGLGHNAFVKMGTILRLQGLIHADPKDFAALKEAITLIDSFLNCCVAGYVEQLEQQLLEDQEKLRIALDRVQKTGQ
jgi:hypothetical protein